MTAPAITVLTGERTDEWARRRFAPEGWPAEQIEVVSGDQVGNSGADVLIIGPTVAEPLAAARAFRRRHPSGQVLFLTSQERLAYFSKVLPFAPEVGEAWVFDAETPEDELRRCITEAREAVKRRQAIRGLYSRINAQVKAAPLGTDSEQRGRQHHALAERYLAAILTHAPDALIAVALDGEVVSWNDAAARVFGRSWDEVAGQHFSDLFLAEDRPAATALLSRVALGDSIRDRELRIARDGILTLELSAGPVLGDGGIIEGISLTARDVTERKRWEEHQRLLINELNHRVKNTLATVQSIASQSLRNAESAEAAQAAMESRLFALSRAHDVLTRESWESAGLKEIVTEAMAPYRGASEARLRVSGPDIRLPPHVALALAMALQELATNAVKYGALSNGTGKVHLRWILRRKDGDTHLHLTWTECGGPPVASPTRRGFGTRLIERSLARELRGEVSIRFAPEGVVCTIEAPIAPIG